MSLHLLGILILFSYGVIVIFSILLNRDIFSPAKIFLFYVFLFHFELIYIVYPLEHYLTFFVFTMIAVLAVLVERYIIDKNNISNTNKIDIVKNQESGCHIAGLTKMIWIFTLIPMAAQIYFILDSGGIIQYINDAVYRVTLWRGKGALLMIIRSVMVLQIIYFMVGLYWGIKKKSWWVLFFLHFLIIMFLALLTGSRGVLLINIIIMLVIYHHIKRPIRLTRVLTVVLILLLVASVLGLARNNLKISENEFQTGLDKEISSSDRFRTLTSTFRYGLIPLDLIYSHEPKNIQYGLGLITPITNVVPRGVWPDKPDTASIAMNKEYVEDRGPGPYQFAAGIIGLGVMNFGWVAGIMFGFLLTILLFIYVEYIYFKNIRYNRFTNFNCTLKALIAVVLMISLPGVIIGEFSNMIVELFLTKLLLIGVFIIYGKHVAFKNNRARK